MNPKSYKQSRTTTPCFQMLEMLTRDDLWVYYTVLHDYSVKPMRMDDRQILDNAYPPLTIFDHLRSALLNAMLLAYINEFQKFLQVAFLRDLEEALTIYPSSKWFQGIYPIWEYLTIFFWDLDLDVLLSNGSGDCLAPLAQALKGDDDGRKFPTIPNTSFFLFFLRSGIESPEFIRIFLWIVFQ